MQLENEQAGADSDAGQPPVVPESQDSAAEPAAAEADQIDIPGELIEKLAKLSHKQSQELMGLRSSLERLGKQGTASAQWQELQELLEKNQQYQQQLQQRMRTQLTALNGALEGGRSRDALSLWDRIQGAIQQCTGKMRHAMQKEAGASKGPVLEMRKWRNFAATEKKKELIAEMGSLPDTGMSAPDLSRRIQKMHEQWKALGRSEQNEKLWREFKQLSDQVYGPCREYFKERKTRMAQNLTIRIELCEKLEQKLAELDGQPVHIVKLNTLISQCNASWKEHAPVEQSRIKSLQKRYYAALKKLTHIRKDAMKENGERKQSCVDRVKALAELDNHNKTAEEVRKLQSQWKQIGPTEFRDEKRCRAEFQTACDAVFKVLNEHRAKKQERSRPPEQRIHAELLENLAPRAEFLRILEQSLFDAKDEDQYSQRLNEFDPESWEQLPPAADETRGDEMSHRLQALREAQTLDKLKSLSSDCEKQQRRICVQLEINAGVNSPREEQSLRMELQLQQLASGFGKRGPDLKQTAQKAREAEIGLLCAGPLAPDVREELQQRLGRLLQRISSRPPRSRTG